MHNATGDCAELLQFYRRMTKQKEMQIKREQEESNLWGWQDHRSDPAGFLLLGLRNYTAKVQLDTLSFKVAHL